MGHPSIAGAKGAVRCQVRRSRRPSRRRIMLAVARACRYPRTLLDCPPLAMEVLQARGFRVWATTFGAFIIGNPGLGDGAHSGPDRRILGSSVLPRSATGGARPHSTLTIREIGPPNSPSGPHDNLQLNGVVLHGHRPSRSLRSRGLPSFIGLRA